MPVYKKKNREDEDYRQLISFHFWFLEIFAFFKTKSEKLAYPQRKQFAAENWVGTLEDILEDTFDAEHHNEFIPQDIQNKLHLFYDIKQPSQQDFEH